MVLRVREGFAIALLPRPPEQRRLLQRYFALQPGSQASPSFHVAKCLRTTTCSTEACWHHCHFCWRFERRLKSILQEPNHHEEVEKTLPLVSEKVSPGSENYCWLLFLPWDWVLSAFEVPWRI